MNWREALQKLTKAATARRARKWRMLSDKPHKMQIMIDNDSEPVQVLAQPSEVYRRLSEIPTTEIREGEL